MAQKYQVAIAIAVLKNKPDNLSQEQYIAQLKDKIEKHNQELDSNVPFTEDFTITDTDFNFNDDSFTIDDIYQSPNSIEKLDKPADIRNQHINENLSQTKSYRNCNINFNSTTEEGTRKKGLSLNNNEVANLTQASADETNSLDDILQTLKDIEENKGCLQSNTYNSSQNHSQMIPSPAMINFSQDIVEENNTIIDSLPNIDVDNLVDECNTQDGTDERVKATAIKKFIKRNKINKPGAKIQTFNEITQEKENISFQNTYDMEVEMALNDILQPENELVNGLNINLSHDNNEIVFKELNKQTCAVNPRNGNTNNKVFNKENFVYNNINKDQNVTATNATDNLTQATILYTLQGYTQNTYSQSQYQNIEIPKTFIHGNNNKHTINYINDNNINTEKNNENERNTDIGRNNINIHDNITQNPNILTVDSSQIQYIIDKNGKTYAVLNSIQLDKGQKMDDQSHKNNEMSSNLHNSMNREKEITAKNTEINTQENTEFDTETNSQVFDIDEYLDKDIDCEEVVPFKVVKELSRIKAYLNKRERPNTDYSSDSGYRSDSQSSYKSVSTRVSDEWLHQSASCLFHYVTQCPLGNVTQEIVSEIAQVNDSVRSCRTSVFASVLSVPLRHAVSAG
ncbi:hypothetical protein O0L34_g10562 [Tuta absoluta]|nr:hypothetical protein O0L34_g10562 [Tuta absoluta]